MTIKIKQFTLDEAIERGKEWAPHNPITRTLVEGVGELRTINRDMLAALVQAVAYADAIARGDGMPEGKQSSLLTATEITNDDEVHTEFDVAFARSVIARAEAHEGQRNNAEK